MFKLLQTKCQKLIYQWILYVIQQALIIVFTEKLFRKKQPEKNIHLFK